LNKFKTKQNKTIFETKPVGLGFENTEMKHFDSFAYFKICFNGKLVSFLQFFSPKEKSIYQTPLPSFIPELLPCAPQ